MRVNVILSHLLIIDILHSQVVRMLKMYQCNAVMCNVEILYSVCHFHRRNSFWLSSTEKWSTTQWKGYCAAHLIQLFS